MKVRLYHYAKVANPAANRKSVAITGKDNFYYDPENILNYVSATRIKGIESEYGILFSKKQHFLLNYSRFPALHAYSDEDDYQENLTSMPSQV